MTPQERAIDLIDKYHLKVNVRYTQDSNPAVMNGAMTVNSSKQCALIAVDEIISLGLLSNSPIKHNAIADVHKEYWQQVKTEIQNL
jgi:hypothetical protein